MTPDPRARYRPGDIVPVVNGDKTQTRRDWLNDEPKNIGLQQEPADTHLTTDGEQA